MTTHTKPQYSCTPQRRTVHVSNILSCNNIKALDNKIIIIIILQKKNRNYAMI